MKLRFLALIIFLLLPSLALAIDYDSYYLEAEINDETIHFDLEASGTFNDEILLLYLPPSIENLEVLVDLKQVTCLESEEVGKTIVACSKQEGEHSISVNFDSSYPLINLNSKELFQFNHEVEASEFLFTLKLPVGYIVSDENSIIPEPTRVYSNGKQIILSWQEDDFSGNFQTSVLTENVTGGNYIKVLIVVAGVIVLIVLSYLAWLKFHRTKKPAKHKKHHKSVVVAQGLLENESKVVKFLKESENKQLWQKELQIKMKISKVKLSRLLKSLEKRRLVKKEAYGASNIIKLIEKNSEEN